MCDLIRLNRKKMLSAGIEDGVELKAGKYLIVIGNQAHRYYKDKAAVVDGTHGSENEEPIFSGDPPSPPKKEPPPKLARSAEDIALLFGKARP